LLYDRAVRVQRFLEPALAISQPRIAFSDGMFRLMRTEFGPGGMAGIVISGDHISVRKDLLFSDFHGSGQADVLMKLGHVFHAMLEEPAMKPNIDVILIGAKAEVTDDPRKNIVIRELTQRTAASVLTALFQSDPALERDHANYFSSIAISVREGQNDTDWIEFYIVPSETLHIEVLQKLKKYAK